MKKGIQITTVLAILAALGGFYVWEKSSQAVAHDGMDSRTLASAVELNLQQIELELKMFRTIEERRPLTADEQARKEYIEAFRLILLSEQQKKVKV